MKKAQTFLFLSLLIFVSCTNKQFYETYSTKIDSLKNTLEASASSYETIDTVLIASQYLTIRQNLDTLVLFPEIALDTGVIKYGYLKKKYKTFLRDHPLTIQELNYSRVQLSDLKNDFDKRNLEIEFAQEYYQTEEEAVDYIKKRMDAYQVMIRESMIKFNSLNPEIVVLLDSLSKTPEN